MDELQFLRLIKVLLSSVLVSPSSIPSDVSSSSGGISASTSCSSGVLSSSYASPFSSSQQASCLSPLSIHELLQTKSVNEFLDQSSTFSSDEDATSALSIRDSPLLYRWAFWNSSYDRNGNVKGLQKNKYMHYVNQTCTFATFGQFIDAWQQTLVSELPVSTSISIFREGISPMWEAPENKDGGKFAFACGTGQEDALQLFFVLTGAIIAGKVGLPGDVCGIVVSFREWGGTIAVWNSNSADAEQLKRIEVSLSQFSSHHICYQPHKVSMQINKFHIKSKYRKNNNNNNHRGRHIQQQPQQPQQQYFPPYYYQQQQPQQHQSYFSYPPFNHQQPYYNNPHPHPQPYPAGRVVVPARVMSFHQPEQQQPQQKYQKPIERPQHNRPMAPPPGFESNRFVEEEPKQEEIVLHPVQAVETIQQQQEEEEASVGSEEEGEEDSTIEEEKEEAPLLLPKVLETVLEEALNEALIEENKQEKEENEEEEVAIAASVSLSEESGEEEEEKEIQLALSIAKEEESEPSTTIQLALPILSVVEDKEEEKETTIINTSLDVNNKNKRRQHKRRNQNNKKKKKTTNKPVVVVAKDTKTGGGLSCGILSAPVMKGANGFLSERLRFIVLNVSVVALLFFSLFGMLAF